MAYGLKYYGRFTRNSAVYKVELLLKDYVGSDDEIDHIMTDPVILKRRSVGREEEGVVKGSELTFNFYSTVDDASKFDEIYTGEWKDWQLKYYKDSTLIWQGWLKTENLTRSFILDHYQLTVNATDGLADLKDIEYSNFTGGALYEDRVDVLDTVKRVLNHTEIDLDFKIQLGMEETLMTPGTLALSNVTHDSTRLSKDEDGRTVQESCFTTLEEVLKPFGVEFFQAEGYWWIQSKAERNSNVFEYDYATLSQQSKTLTDVSIDITAYSFEDLGELQQLRLVKHHETTFLDKNLANNLIVNGNFDTNSDWTASGLDSDTITGGEYILVDSSGTGYVESSTFSLTSIPTNSTFTISWKAKNVSQTPSGDPFYSPVIRCALFYGSTEVAPSTTSDFFLFEGAEYVTHQTTFPVTVDSSGYKVRFYLEKNVTLYTSVTVHIDDVISSANWSISGSTTTDSTHRLTNDDIVASSLEKSEVFFGDSANDDDLGALMVGGVRTSSWDRYGEGDGLTIQETHALEKLVQRSVYKDYLRLKIKDTGDNIKLYERLKINSTYYRILSYTKTQEKYTLEVELEEIITTTPTYSSQLYILNSVAGESRQTSQSSGAGAQINDAVTSTSQTWSSNKISNELSSIEWSDIGAKPTTLAGFGITDAYTKTESDAAYAASGHNHTGVYEPYDTNITKDNVAETITANWEFSGTPEFSGVPDFSNPALPFTVAVGSGMATNLDANYLNGKADSYFEPAIGAKGTAFNKNFGATASDVATGNHTHAGTLLDTDNAVITGNWTFAGSTHEFGMAPDFSAASGAPFTTSLTTVVTNLNADRLDGYHASSFATSSHNHTGVYEPYDTDITKKNESETITGNWTFSATHLFDSSSVVDFDTVPDFNNSILPFTVHSNSNLVTYLNADLLDGYHQSSFVRLNDTTPTSGYLYVQASTSNSALRARQDGSGYIQSWYDSTTQEAYMTQAGLMVADDFKGLSDERRKTEFRKVKNEDMFKKVLSIAELIRDYKRIDRDYKKELGWGAQTLYNIAPEYVHKPEDPEEMWAVGYSKMVVPLYGAIASIDKRLKRIEKKLKL